MLNYAILNEAWGGSKKKQSLQQQSKLVIQDVQDPLVLRISDKDIIENLKIYKEDYKETLLINIIKNYFENNKEEETTTTSTTQVETMANYNVEMSDDMKEIMYIMLVLIFVLYFTNKICGNFKV